MTRDASAATAGSVRAVRTVLLASAAVLVALGGHLAGGGAAPSLPVLVGTVVAAAALAHRLSARRWTARTLLGTLVLLQAAVHLVCSLPGGGAHAMAMHGTSAPSPWAMPAWHAVATLATAAALLWGERLLWALLDALGLERLAVLRPHPAAPRTGGASVVVAVAPGPARWLLVTGGGDRGPPRGR